MAEILILQGNANDFDQRTIEYADTEKLEFLFRADSYKEAMDWLVQALNDEYIDVTNNFLEIREV